MPNKKANDSTGNFMDLLISAHPTIMTKTFTTLALLISSFHLSAQEQNPRILRMDTINVSGKIISLDGSKVSNVWIQSRTPNKKYINNINEGTYTDSLGNFVLNGIKPIDTLSFRAFRSDHTFINHGSRSVTITISPTVLSSISPDNPQVIAKRIHKKKEASFTLIQDDVICGYYGFTTQASFPDGIKKFVEYINKNLVYPPIAIQNNIEGTVTVEFSIFKEGAVIKPKIINGLGYGCDEAAINVVLKGPRWTPAIENAKPVVSTYQIDISFKLQD